MGTSENENDRTLLVVHHSPTERVEPIAQRVIQACQKAADEVADAMGDDAPTINVVERQALEPDAEELRQADAVILGTTANFGYISGALKHYFDTLFYEVNEEKVGTPVSWWIRGGKDTTGAEKALRSIIAGLKWEISAEPVEFVGDVEPHNDELDEMAQAMVGTLVQ